MLGISHSIAWRVSKTILDNKDWYMISCDVLRSLKDILIGVYAQQGAQGELWSELAEQIDISWTNVYSVWDRSRFTPTPNLPKNFQIWIKENKFVDSWRFKHPR